MTTDILGEPEHLYGVSPVSDADAMVKAIHRLATAVEQNTLAILDQRVPPAVQITTQQPVLSQLPPVQVTQTAQNGDGCPIHHTAWKLVPAGVSKRTGKPYDAFRACSTSGCDQRPAR
jgi:hypothetical protein